MIFAAGVLALVLTACGGAGGGTRPAGGAATPVPAAATPAPQATTQAQPADATKAPSPSKSMDDDPYGYGY